MVASLLYYKKFAKSLKSKGFKLNPYDPCVTNKHVNGEQLTVCFHVDNCKILHLTPDKTIEWLQSEYKNVFEDGTGQMKVHCSKTHKYLGMALDFSQPNQCRVTMIDYVDEIAVAYDKALKDLSDGFNAVTKMKNVARTSAAPDDLFIINKHAEKLSEEGEMAFHILVAKALYVSKRARPDVIMAIAFSSNRYRAPDAND
jgi:hypothetical protein